MLLKYSANRMILYSTLVCAALNDLLRIPDTQISLFRILMPISILYCLCVNIHMCKYFRCLFVLLAINILQSMVYSEMNAYGIGFSIDNFCWNAYFYICIVSVVVIMDTLAKKDLNFIRNVESLVERLAYLFLTILIVVLFVPDIYTVLRSHNVLTNINDIAANIGAIYPMFLYNAIKYRDRKSVLFCIISLLVVVLLGRKLVTVGVIVESIFLILIPMRRITIKGCINIVILFVCGFLVYTCYYEVIDKLFAIADTVFDSVVYIYEEQLFDKVNTSQAFRVSVFIYGMQEVINSNFVGIGIGNTAYLLREIMPMGNYMFKADGTVSSHNFVVQLLLEFGVIAVMMLGGVFKYLIRICKECKKNRFHYIFISMMIGVWFWFLAPSGFYTTYYIYIVFLYVIFSIRRNRFDI